MKLVLRTIASLGFLGFLLMLFLWVNCLHLPTLIYQPFKFENQEKLNFSFLPTLKENHYLEIIFLNGDALPPQILNIFNLPWTEKLENNDKIAFDLPFDIQWSISTADEIVSSGSFSQGIKNNSIGYSTSGIFLDDFEPHPWKKHILQVRIISTINYAQLANSQPHIMIELDWPTRLGLDIGLQIAPLFGIPLLIAGLICFFLSLRN